MSYDVPYFTAEEGWFPFPVPRLTTAEITALVQYGMTAFDEFGAPVPVAVNNCLVIDGLTLQEAYDLYWKKRGIVAHSATFGDIPILFNQPSARVCGEAAGGGSVSEPATFPTAPADGDRYKAISVSASFAVGLYDYTAYPLGVSPIFYNNENETYTVCISMTSSATDSFWVGPWTDEEGYHEGTWVIGGAYFATGTNYPMAGSPAFTINTFGGRPTSFYFAGESIPDGTSPDPYLSGDFTEETDFTILPP